MTLPNVTTPLAATRSPGTPRIVSIRPKWFIIRPNGKFVPLVPADELPEAVELCEAPRDLGVDQLARMECLGGFEGPEGSYSLHPTSRLDSTFQRPRGPVDDPKSHPDSSTLNTNAVAGHESPTPADLTTNDFLYPEDARPDDLRAASRFSLPMHGRFSSRSTGVRPSEYAGRVDMLAPHTPDQWNRIGSERVDPDKIFSAFLTTANRGKSLADAILDSDPRAGRQASFIRRPPPPSGYEPDQSKKTHCTYWIRTGECDYTQQGCMYKHEMPDAAKLKELGFRETPKWWRDQMGQSSQFRRPPTIKRVGVANKNVVGADDTTSASFSAARPNRNAASGIPHAAPPANDGRPIELPTSSISRRVKEEAERNAAASHPRTYSGFSTYHGSRAPHIPGWSEQPEVNDSLSPTSSGSSSNDEGATTYLNDRYASMVKPVRSPKRPYHSPAW